MHSRAAPMLIWPLLWLAAACAPLLPEPPGTILDAQGRELSETALVAKLAGADIVVLGEVHDNKLHHARQARLVAALAPAGLAFEMVPEASEEGVQVFLTEGGSPDEIGPAIGWERMGWPDWDAYAPIFEAAPGAYIAGGGVARRQVRRALQIGAAAAYGAGAGKIGLTQPLAPALRAAVEDEMIAAHCDMLPREMATSMVEAQRLRDARFAEAVLRARVRGGGKAVLITGNGHARSDRGVPAYLGTVAPDLTVRSVGMVEAADGSIQGPLPFDYVWISPPAKRDDPCEGFG